MLSENSVVGEKYQVIKRIGGGSFGEIYDGKDIATNESVAIKIEDHHVIPIQLEFESKLYQVMAGGVGVAHIKYFGKIGKDCVMVMEKLSDDLETLFRYCGYKFSLKTVLMLADQILERIEYMHCKNLVHRDIKPENFIMGTNKKKNVVYIIDYGLSKVYRDAKTMKHRPYKEGKHLTGTARYVSLNTHAGIEQSRRDDMESIAYLLIYLLKGSLPWQGIQTEDRDQKFALIYSTKQASPPAVLCHGLPKEFEEYLVSVKNLEYSETPPYSKYRQMFRDLFIRHGYVFDYNFDWVVQQKKKRASLFPTYPNRIHPIMKENDENSPENIQKNELKDEPRKVKRIGIPTWMQYTNPVLGNNSRL